MKRLFVVLALLACGSPTAPQDTTHVCDREKRAVWAALGNETPVPDSLMAVSEWNLPRSDRGLHGETYYFLVFASNPTECKVLRA